MSKSPSMQLLRPNGERYTFNTICEGGQATAAQLFLRGTAPRLGEVAGWEYRGRNLPLTAVLLHIRRFIKGFLVNPKEPNDPQVIDGYNLWAHQARGLDEPWEPSTPKRHGFYKIARVVPGALDSRYPHAVLLDYGLGENPWYHPARFLRDYLVQVYPDDPRLLVGVAYVAFGPFRVFGGYFVMERANPNGAECKSNSRVR